MKELTKSQATSYNAIFENTGALKFSTADFKNELSSIFGMNIFPHFLHAQHKGWSLSDYFKNVILLTKFLTCLALEKEDDSIFHPFYHDIATACITFLKKKYPEQTKSKDFIYTPDFETLLHSTFFNSLCVKPEEIDRAKSLFSIKSAIIGSKQLLETCSTEYSFKQCQRVAHKPFFSRLPERASKAMVEVTNEYMNSVQDSIKKLAAAQKTDIILDLKSIHKRLQSLTHELNSKTRYKVALFHLKQLIPYMSVLSFGMIITAFTIYQTGGDLASTALALLLSILLLAVFLSLNDLPKKMPGRVSTLTKEIESVLENQEEELITQSTLEKQTYQTIKPSSPDASIREEKKDTEEEKSVVSYVEYFFGFSGLQPTQIQTRKMRTSLSSSSQSSSFFPVPPLPVKEVLPPHYKRDSLRRLVLFDPDKVLSIGKSEVPITPKDFSESTYSVHQISPSDNLKRCGINAGIAFKLKPKKYSNVRAYGIAEEQIINGKPETVCVVTHLRIKVH